MSDNLTYATVQVKLPSRTREPNSRIAAMFDGMHVSTEAARVFDVPTGVDAKAFLGRMRQRANRRGEVIGQRFRVSVINGGDSVGVWRVE